MEYMTVPLQALRRQHRGNIEVSSNVMALRWAAGGMFGGGQGSPPLEGLQAYKHLPVFTAGLAAQQSNYVIKRAEDSADAA